MLIDFNLYLNHPYCKKIIDYFDHVDFTRLSGQSHYFNIRDTDLNYQLPIEADFIKTEDQMIDYVNDRMKYLVVSIIYSMMKQKGFNEYKSYVDLDEHANKIKVSLHTINRQKEILTQIEKTIGEKSFVFNRQNSVDLEDTDIGIYDYRYVDLFEINLDNFSFEDIDKQLEEYTKIKDQLISELQNM